MSVPDLTGDVRRATRSSCAGSTPDGRRAGARVRRVRGPGGAARARPPRRPAVPRPGRRPRRACSAAACTAERYAPRRGVPAQAPERGRGDRPRPAPALVVLRRARRALLVAVVARHRRLRRRPTTTEPAWRRRWRARRSSAARLVRASATAKWIDHQLRGHHRPADLPPRRAGQAGHRDPARAGQHRLLQPVHLRAHARRRRPRHRVGAARRASETFSDIRRPSAVQNEIYRQMEANENRKYDRGQPSRGRRRRAASIPEQIEARRAAPAAACITEAEFAGEEGPAARPHVTRSSSASSRRSPRRCWRGARRPSPSPASASSPTCRTSAAPRTPTSPPSSRSRPTSSSSTTRRTAGRTPTRSSPPASTSTCVLRIDSVADVGPRARAPRGRGRRAAPRSSSRAAAADAPARARGVRADLAAAVDDAERRHLRLVGARAPRHRQRLRRRRRRAIPRSTLDDAAAGRPTSCWRRRSRTRSPSATSPSCRRSRRSCSSTARTCSGGACARRPRRRLRTQLAAALAADRRRRMRRVRPATGRTAQPSAGRRARRQRDDAAAEAGAGEAGAVDAAAWRAARSTSASSAGSTPRSRRGRLAWLVDHRARRRSRGRRRRARRRTARTRAFSVMTWRARRRSTGSSMRLDVGRRRPGGSGPTSALGRLALAPPLGVGRGGEAPGSPESTTTTSTSSGSGTGVDGERVAVDQQGVALDPGQRRELVHDPARHARRPLLGPLAAARPASQRVEPVAPRASATATSSAALDESPAPTAAWCVTVAGEADVGRTSATTPAT